MRVEILLDFSWLEKTFRSTIYRFMKEMIASDRYLYERIYVRERTKDSPFTFAAVLPPRDRRYETEDRIVPLAPVRVYFSTWDADVMTVVMRYLDRKLYSSLVDPVVIRGSFYEEPVTVKVLRVRELEGLPGEVSGMRVRFPSLVVNHHRYRTVEELFERAGFYFESERPYRVYYVPHRNRDVGIKLRVYDLEGRVFPKNREAEVKLRKVLLSGFGWRKGMGFGYPFLQREGKNKKVELEHRQKPVVTVSQEDEQ